MINFKKDFEKFYMQRRFSSLTSPNPPDIDYFKDFNSAKKIEVELKENHMLFGKCFFCRFSHDFSTLQFNIVFLYSR